MKLRTKATLFFGIFLLLIALGISLYAEYVVGNVFKKQAINNLQIIAEQSEGAYLSFLGSLKVRALDWTSDSTLRNLAKAILSTTNGSAERARATKEFAIYVSEKKMPFDKTIFLTELLDRDGIVISSTNPENIGKNEKDEETAGRKEHNFTDTINSKFGEVSFGSIVFRDDRDSKPSLNATVRLFDFGKNGETLPLDAVLLVYFSNVQQIAEVLGSGTSIYAGTSEKTGRQTSQALLENYHTSELYLVNTDSIMVTPSRTVEDITVKQKVDTVPVRECLDNGKEISEEYDNYAGVRVLGASMCFQKEGIVVLVEIEKGEIFAPMTTLIQSTAIGVSVALVFGILIIIIFMRRPLARINDVVLVAKQVEKGDLGAQVAVRTKDEIGYLAASFNAMIAAIRNVQKELQVSKHKVEEEKAKDEALLASLGEGMIATDKSGNIIAINRMAGKMLGLRSEDVIGRKAVDMWSVLDEDGKETPWEQRPISIAATGVATISKTMNYRRKDGGYFPVSVTVTPVILESKVIGSIDIFRDITKEKEIEKTRGDLLSLASHQLRTPLSGTKWLIETLKRGLHGPLTAGQTEYLDEIYKINERMTGLVHDMLGVLRMEGDGTLAKKETASTKVLLATLFETLHGVAESKQITIRLPENADYMLNTDPLLLGNILESLVSNAINYSESGREVVVSVEQISLRPSRMPESLRPSRESTDPEIGDSSADSEIVFAIKDSGIGIPHDEQRQIFERFYRASNAKTFDTRGSGLGLYIAAMLAKKIGAHLSFESEEGKGSTFFVHIPYQQTSTLPENTTRV